MKKSLIIGAVVVAIAVVILLSLNSIETIKDTQTSPLDRNREESQVEEENEIVEDKDSTVKGPGGCEGAACNEYCSNNEEECEIWCQENSDICADIMGVWGAEADQSEEEQPQPEEEPQGRQGDGVWDKSELTFYIKDEENVLSGEKREVIQEVIFSE